MIEKPNRLATYSPRSTVHSQAVELLDVVLRIYAGGLVTGVFYYYDQAERHPE